MGWAGAYFVGKLSHRLHLLDFPTGRSSHEAATSKGGGIGILASFVLVSIALDMPATFIISGTLISLISFYADSRDLSVKFRLGIHFLAAALLILPFLYDAIRFSASAEHILIAPVFWVLIYVLFVVATANFYNFMDGINGIAAVTGIVASGLIIMYYHQFLHINAMPVSSFAALAACVGFSCLGFLPFNMPGARVFMGDVGSVLLGFIFAGLILELAVSFLDLICMASFLFLFYADELTTMWIRLRDHERLTVAHRRHFYQLLANDFRMPHWQVTALYGLAQLIIGLSVIFTRHSGLVIVLPLLSLYFVVFILVSTHFRRKLVSIQETGICLNERNND
jgi:Fuc2NAc and GlcNAc transferase